MKRTLVLAAAALVLMAAPAFCEWRFDLGVDGVFGLGAVTDEGADSIDFGSLNFFTLPMGGASYEWQLGPVGLGAGVRGITLLFVNVLWPDIYAEMELGPAALEAHVGGLLFLGFGLVSFSESGEVFVPELSAWFKLGRMFRLGGGAIGLYVPDFSGMAFVYYIGAKWVIKV